MNHQNLSEKNFYAKLSSPKERLSAFRQIKPAQQGFILLALSKPLQSRLLSQLSDQEVIEILQFLDADQETDLLQSIENGRRKLIIRQLSEPVREKVEFLLKFDPQTAAGMMTLEFIQVPIGTTFEQLGKMIRTHERRSGKFPTILVVEKGFLVGEVPAHVLATVKKSEKVEKYLKKIIHISHEQKDDEVVELFESHPHNKIAVLNEDGTVLGIIYSEDVLHALRMKAGESLRDFAGVADEEDVLDSPLAKVRNRYKWLIINLGTAFLAASVVSLFEADIAAFTLLAIYMPIIAGMGGNAATQTLAVVVRGLTLKKIDLSTGWQVIQNEMIAGAVNGLINGIIVAVIATFFNHSPLFGLIVGISMIVNLVAAGFFGALIPLIMKKLGKDPAASATIFITTATDVLGFFFFLGLASLLL